LLASGISGFHIPAAMIRGRIAIPGKDPKRWRSRGYLLPAVVMAALLGACTTSSMNTVRLYNSSTGETVQCGPFDTGQPQNCVAYYTTHGFMPAHP
jgi:hypothetical protein